MTGSINHPPQAASAPLSVLCTHLSISTQQVFSTDVLNQWIKHVCFPKQNSAIQTRLSLAGQSRKPRVTTGVTENVTTESSRFCKLTEIKSVGFRERIPQPALLIAPKRKIEGSSSPLASQTPPSATCRSIRNRTLPKGWGLSAVVEG